MIQITVIQKAFAARIKDFSEEKRRIQTEYDRQIAEIDAKINEERAVWEQIAQTLAPIVCKACGGEGQRTYTDAAGGRDWETCPTCRGTGIA